MTSRFKIFQNVDINQGGITCEAIDEPGKSSKAIDKRVIINFRDKNVVIARFRDKTAYVWGLCYQGTRIPGSRTLCHPGGFHMFIA